MVGKGERETMLQTWCRAQGTCSAAGREPRWWTQGRPSPVDGTPSSPFLLPCVWIVVYSISFSSGFSLLLHWSPPILSPSITATGLPPESFLIIATESRHSNVDAAVQPHHSMISRKPQRKTMKTEKKTTIPLSLESTAHFYNFCCTRRDIRKKIVS